MIVLDTHVLLWLERGDDELGPRSRKKIDRALAQDELAVSAMTFGEIAMLERKNRIRLARSAETLRIELIGNGLREIPLTGEIAIASTRLENLHDDPADRIIIASATGTGATLLTADDRILKWKGRLERYDARL